MTENKLPRGLSVTQRFWIAGIAAVAGVAIMSGLGWYLSKQTFSALGQTSEIDAASRKIMDFRLASSELSRTSMDVIVDRASKAVAPGRQAEFDKDTDILRNGVDAIVDYAKSHDLEIDEDAFRADVNALAATAHDELPSLVAKGADDVEIGKVVGKIDTLSGRVADVVSKVSEAARSRRS